jgi:hypothetical protein
VIAAVLLSVALLLLAVVVDGGRLYLEHGRTKRAVQAAADAGIGVAAEHVVTLAVIRQTQAAEDILCLTAPAGACTPTPPPGQPAAWLTDEDRATLVSAPVQTEAAEAALAYALHNGLTREDTLVEYPHDFAAEDSNVRIRVQTERELAVLLAGLLSPDLVHMQVSAVSQVPQH